MELLDYLKQFKGKKGLYIIKPKDTSKLEEICNKLGFNYSNKDIAYVGKAEKCLYARAKQEMGWANFEGATFVRKMGLFLDYDIKDKRNKTFQESTKEFILNTFTIECIEFDMDVQQKETEYVRTLNPCLNVKKKLCKI